MPERNHEVIIDGFLFPDTVTVTLANDEYINSRDYVDKELYESICAANDAWQEQNAKLRELMTRMAEALGIDCEWADPDWCKSPCVLEFGCWPEGDHTAIRCPAWAAMRELGVEVDA